MSVFAGIWLAAGVVALNPSRFLFGPIVLILISFVLTVLRIQRSMSGLDLDAYPQKERSKNEKDLWL
jgi:hypothetical protein